MKRLMLEAAMIGTFALAIGYPAMAEECRQNDSHAPKDCRVIQTGNLGAPYCLVPENFSFRSIKAGGPEDPWVTDLPIKLGTFSMNPTDAGRACQAGARLSSGELKIEKRDGKYYVTVSGPTSISVNMDITHDAAGNDLWLSGTDSVNHDLNYFVFFRDKAAKSQEQSAATGLPKFLVIQALDFSDGACKAVEPSVSTHTVVSNSCPSHAAQPRDTGVGGGGEGGKNP